MTLTGQADSHWDYSQVFKRYFAAFVFRPAPGQFGVIVSDITERKEDERRSQLQAQMLDSVGQAVIATDIKQAIIYRNEAAANLFGWSSEDAVGTHMQNLLPLQMSLELQSKTNITLQRGDS